VLAIAVPMMLTPATTPLLGLVGATVYLATVWAGSSLGNTGLWLAMLVSLASRGLGKPSPTLPLSGVPSGHAP
jgi:hypothetical protein